MPAPLTITRRTLLVVWAVLIAAVLSLVLGMHLAALLGYRGVVISGSSMTPSIPLGSLVFETVEIASQIAPGDVVTLSLPQGAIVTHRVTRTVNLDGRLYLEVKGDANTEPDAALHPATVVAGVVRFHVPIAGFALAFLGIPTGILCVLSMLGSLLAAIWLLEEVDADRRVTRAAGIHDLAGHGLPA